MEKISQIHFDKSDLITVSCPQCSENLFTFSHNILEKYPKGGFPAMMQQQILLTCFTLATYASVW